MYKIDNPPDQIKNLPAHGKTIWIKAYNAAYVEYEKDETKATATAWAATKNVYEQDEKGNWVEIKKMAYDYISVIELSEVAIETETKTSWIDIIREGTWQHQIYGQINITADKLKKFADNFSNRILGRDVSITIEHNDGLGRIGEFKEVKIEDGKLKGLIEWTEKGLTLLSEKAFKYFSPEYVENYIDKVSKEGQGVCLVGGSVTNKPFLTGLSPVCMSETAAIDDMKILGEVFKMADGTGTLTAAQAARSKEYGIGVKDSTYLELPDRYRHLTDDQFADPVNYSYPIDQEEIMCSYRNFIGSYGYGEMHTNHYTEDEKKIISKRIYDRLPDEYKEKAMTIMTFSEIKKVEKEKVEKEKKLTEGGRTKMEELKAAQDKIAAMEIQLSDVTAKQQATETLHKVTEAKLWQAEVDAEVKKFNDACKLYPFEVDFARVILSHKGTDADVIKLSDATGKEIAMTPGDAFRKMMDMRPAVIDLSERTKASGEITLSEQESQVRLDVKADMKAAGFAVKEG